VYRSLVAMHLTTCSSFGKLRHTFSADRLNYLSAVKIADVEPACVGLHSNEKSTDGPFRSMSFSSDAVSVTSSSTITSVASDDDKEECIVFDQHGRIIQMDPMLYEALSGLIETDDEA